MGFFTDTTLCIGCKACEVACKQWNQLPADGFEFTGNSYDNTGHLVGDDLAARRVQGEVRRADAASAQRWLMISDVCKHCEEAPCQQSCPTGALIYNEFGDVYVQNGHLQRLRLLHRGLPVRRARPREPERRRPRPQMHALLGPPGGRA